MLVPLEYLDDTEQLEYATQAILDMLDDGSGVTTVQRVADATGLDPHLIRNAAWIMLSPNRGKVFDNGMIVRKI